MSQDIKKEKSIEERLVELHPKFLEAIKETYPLAVLGSFCITIAAFTTQTYPDAQTYAITAASLFLIAFVVSFLFKIINLSNLALISYVSTALATVFLFLVIGTFAQAIPMVSKSLFVISDTISAFVFLVIGYLFYKYYKNTKSSIIRLCCTISLPLIIFIIGYYAVGMLVRFIGFSIPLYMSDVLFSISIFVCLLFAVVIFIRQKERKKEKKTNNLD